MLVKISLLEELLVLKLYILFFITKIYIMPNKTLKYKSKKNKTLKKSPKNKKNKKTNSLNSKKNFIVKNFLEILTVVKLYHWKTYSYAHHEATDELYYKLNKHIDEFIEVLLGKDESRINKMNDSIKLNNNNTAEFKDKIYQFRNFLHDMDNYLNPKKDSDLLNIRDEILSYINQFLYLSTFK